MLGSGTKPSLQRDLPEPVLPKPLGDIPLPERLPPVGAPPEPLPVLDPVRPAGTVSLTVLNARHQPGVATGIAVLDGARLTLVQWLPWEDTMQTATRIGHELNLPAGAYILRASRDAAAAATEWTVGTTVEVAPGKAGVAQLDAMTHTVVVSATAAGEILRAGTPLLLGREGDPTWRLTIDGKPPVVGAENLLRLQLGPGTYDLAPLAWGGAAHRFTVPARDEVRADFAR